MILHFLNLNSTKTNFWSRPKHIAFPWIKQKWPWVKSTAAAGLNEWFFPPVTVLEKINRLSYLRVFHFCVSSNYPILPTRTGFYSTGRDHHQRLFSPVKGARFGRDKQIMMPKGHSDCSLCSNYSMLWMSLCAYANFVVFLSLSGWRKTG